MDAQSEQIRRLYVDSPIFTDDDQEKYKFISTEVDEFDDTQDALLQKSTRRVPTGQSNPSIHSRQEVPPPVSSASQPHSGVGQYGARRTPGPRTPAGVAMADVNAPKVF